jgi:hypothetical protein
MGTARCFADTPRGHFALSGSTRLRLVLMASRSNKDTESTRSRTFRGPLLRSRRIFIERPCRGPRALRGGRGDLTGSP